MSGSVDYRVVTAYEAVDKQTPTINKIAGASKDAASKQVDLLGGIARAGDMASGIFDSVASQILGVTKVIAAAGVAAVGLGTKIGLSVNNELEDARIGLATIFNMLGASGSFDQGLGMAEDLMAKIRADAAALPGEFGDFVGMAKTLSAPLINAGKGMEDIRNLTRDTVVATASLLGTGKGAMEMGAREMAQLLEGRAGVHNTLGMRLGISKDTVIEADGRKVGFNKATEEERFEFLTKALAKAKESMPAFQRSWAGLTSTMADDAKRLLGTSTLPLFEKLKAQFGRINEVLESPRAAIVAQRVGAILGKAFDFAVYRVEYLIENWNGIGGELADFGQRLKTGFEKAWPIIEKVMGVLSKQLEDPERLAGTLLAARGLSGIASNAGAIGKGASALFGGSEGAAAGAGAAVGIGALAAVAVAAVALVGAFDVLRQGGEDAAGMLGGLASWGEGVWEHVKENFGTALEETTSTLKTLWQEARPLVDLLGVFLLGAVDAVIYAFRGLIAPVKLLADAIMWAIKKIPGAATAFGISDAESSFGDALGKVKDPKAIDRSKLDAELAAIDAKAISKKLHGSGKTTINNNFAMTVMQENDPERFARQISTILDKRLKYPMRPVGISTHLPG